MKSHVFVMLGLLAMAPAAAQSSDTNTTSQQPAQTRAGNGDGENSEAENDPNRRICRKVETNTGSRVPHRTVCLTERQWRNYRPD